jgi:2-dehydro-3-deoxyphosphooctonate aldolase (KDO 8-P synthase)
MWLIAGPCVIEDDKMPFIVAKKIKEIANELGFNFIFKSSYLKANRSRIDSFTGIPRHTALEILKEIHNQYQIPVITDVHESWECEEVAEYIDYLQIPAFLCRQTELLISAGKTGKPINIKKGQFMSPESMQFAIEKVIKTGNDNIFLTERGSMFGYYDLIVDMTAIPRMKSFGYPVLIDATHSVQMPNRNDGVTHGQRDYVPTIALAGIAAGADGIFMEIHPDPAKALSDAETQWPLDQAYDLLVKIKNIFLTVNNL